MTIGLTADGLNVPAWVFWIIAIAFLVIAQFRVWRSEHIRRAEAMAKMEVAQSELARLKKDHGRVRTVGAGRLEEACALLTEHGFGIIGPHGVVTNEYIGTYEDGILVVSTRQKPVYVRVEPTEGTSHETNGD